MVKQDLNYKVSLKACLIAKKKALRLIMGDYRAQFGLVRDYGNEILRQNPGSTVQASIMKNENDQSIFTGTYICLGALKHGFLEGCRSVLSIDGYFIKGPWKGQILVAVGRDGNNQMYPVAWAVTQREKYFHMVLIYEDVII